MDPINDPLAALDQATAACSDMARLLATYRRELLSAGFDRGETLALVLGYQSAILSDGSSSD